MIFILQCMFSGQHSYHAFLIAFHQFIRKFITAFDIYQQYPEAFDEFDHSVRDKGEITDVFLADSATLRYFPPALYWLGRCHEALGNAEAAGERYREYLAIRGDAEPPGELAADAAARLAG